MKRKRRKKSLNPNLIIDQMFHPLFKEDKVFVIIDGAFHFMVEQDTKKSVKKFLKYSLRHLIK
jgi:hypothetical protein